MGASDRGEVAKKPPRDLNWNLEDFAGSVDMAFY